MTRKQQKRKRLLARLNLIQYQSENVTGLPRPLAEHHADETVRPVAWTQSGTAWGRLDGYRAELARQSSLCLVCGEEVLNGVVLWSCLDDTLPDRDQKWYDAPPTVTYHDLNNGRISDNGPLHDPCAKLTRAHCRHIRERMHKGTTVTVPYIGPVLHGRA